MARLKGTLYFISVTLALRLSSTVGVFEKCGSQLRNCSIVSTGVYNCSQRMFRSIPCFPNGTTSIDLSQNRIVTLGNSLAGLQSLQELNLASNYIDYITMDAFSDLVSLEVLDISSNKLNETSFPARVFKSLHNIKKLSLQNNVYNRYPADIFGDLGSLQSLYIDVFEDFEFTEEFLSLIVLSQIEFYPRNSFFSLHNNTFIGLSNSPILYLHLNFDYWIRLPIDINVLSPFKHLRGIKINVRLSGNVQDALSMLYGLRGLHLEYIDLSNNLGRVSIPVRLQGSDFSSLVDICVEKVDFTGNDIAEFPFETFFGTTFSQCLYTFIIGDNHIESGYLLPLMQFFFYPKIRDFDISYITGGKRNIQNYENIIERLKSVSIKSVQNKIKITMHMSKSLQKLNASHIFMYRDHSAPDNMNFVLEAPGLRHLDLSYTSLNILCSPGLQLTYKTDLRHMDISGWSCSKLNPNFLFSIQSLEILIFRRSMLDRGLKSDTDGEFLRGLKALITVDLSENNLQELHKHHFRDQTQLKHLILDDNAFDHLPDCISHMKNVEVLSLKNNRLFALSSDETLMLKELDKTHLYLGGNRFDCECTAIESLKWMQRNSHKILDFQTLRCKDYTLLMNITNNIRQFELKCISTYWLNFSITILVLSSFGLITGAFAVRYKVTLEYFYLRLRMFVNRHESKTQSEGYTYDAFLSYSHHDTNWVVNVLYKHMTETLGQNVCLHDKDFRVGHWISDEIIRCIDESRYVVFTITRQFLDSDWSTYEMEMARMHAFRAGRTGLIIIMKESIPLEEMPNTLKRIWWRVVCLEWPNEGNFESEALFWSKLKFAFHV